MVVGALPIVSGGPAGRQTQGPFPANHNPRQTPLSVASRNLSAKHQKETTRPEPDSRRRGPPVPAGEERLRPPTGTAAPDASGLRDVPGDKLTPRSDRLPTPQGNVRSPRGVSSTPGGPAPDARAP